MQESSYNSSKRKDIKNSFIQILEGFLLKRIIFCLDLNINTENINV